MIMKVIIVMGGITPIIKYCVNRLITNYKECVRKWASCQKIKIILIIKQTIIIIYIKSRMFISVQILLLQ
jgi:hypothetical protein